MLIQIQILAGFPLPDHAKAIFIMDIRKNSVVSATFFSCQPVLSAKEESV